MSEADTLVFVTTMVDEFHNGFSSQHSRVSCDLTLGAEQQLIQHNARLPKGKAGSKNRPLVITDEHHAVLDKPKSGSQKRPLVITDEDSSGAKRKLIFLD